MLYKRDIIWVNYELYPVLCMILYLFLVLLYCMLMALSKVDNIMLFSLYISLEPLEKKLADGFGLPFPQAVSSSYTHTNPVVWLIEVGKSRYIYPIRIHIKLVGLNTCVVLRSWVDFATPKLCALAIFPPTTPFRHKHTHVHVHNLLHLVENITGLGNEEERKERVGL